MAAKHVQARRLECLYIEGAQGWNDGREAVKRQAYRVFNVYINISDVWQRKH